MTSAGAVFRTIERLQAHRTVALVVGCALEGVVMATIGLDAGVRDIRGIGGESGVVLAVFGAIAAGPLVGGAMALVGWAVFFPAIAREATSSLVALPLWLVTGVAVGLLSARLVSSERARARAELDAVAAHELRTPVATIHGMAQTLRTTALDGGGRDKLLDLIEHESRELLRRPPFDRGE